MAYCKHCGAEINDDAAFCPKCGQAQSETAPQQPQQQQQRKQNRNLPATRHLRTVQAVPAVHQLLTLHRVDPMVRQLQAMQASLLVTHMSMVVPV